MIFVDQNPIDWLIGYIRVISHDFWAQLERLDRSPPIPSYPQFSTHSVAWLHP